MHVIGNVFVDREVELKLLDRAWEERPGFLVLYGRRRMGKTRLILEWCRRSGKPFVYYHATPAKHEVNLRELARAVEEQLEVKGFSKIRYSTLDSLLENLSYRVGDAVIVLDEYTYWARSSPEVSGELQRFIDHSLGDTEFLLVVVGSLVGVMYREVLGGGAPLYGRARYKVKLGELDPWYIPLFYSNKTLEDTVRLYSLLGGTPYYHQLASRINEPVSRIILELFLEDHAPLRDEVIFLLREEFREPTVYYSILKAIARGANTISKISDYTGIHRQHLPKYLAILRNLGFIGYEKPLFSKKGYYYVKDKVMNTWFRLIEPLVSQSAKLPPSKVDENIRKGIEEIAGKVFEEIALKYIEYLARENKISYDEIGRFLHKGVEIDIIAVNHRRKQVHVFEVKWSDLNSMEAKRIARSLHRKTLHIPLEYDYITHLIVKNYRGEPLDNTIIHTLKDMPFHKNNKNTQRTSPATTIS